MSQPIQGRKINIKLPDDLRDKLEAESQRTGAPLATLVRRAIEAYLAGPLAPAPAAALPQVREAFRWVLVNDPKHPQVEAVMLPVDGFSNIPSELTSLPPQPALQPPAQREHPVNESAAPQALQAAPQVRRRRRRAPVDPVA